MREIIKGLRSDHKICCRATDGGVRRELGDMKVNQQPCGCFRAYYNDRIYA